MMNQNTRKTSANIVEVRGFITNFEKIQQITQHSPSKFITLNINFAAKQTPLLDKYLFIMN